MVWEQQGWWRAMRVYSTVFRGVVRLCLVVVFLGVPAVVLYLREVGLEFGLRERVAEALSGEGFVTTIERLTVDPFEGLVAENVVLAMRGGGRSDYARIERVVISVNFTALFERRLVIDSLTLDETDVSLPLDASGELGRIDVTNVTAEAVLLPDTLRVSAFSGRVGGVRVRVSATLFHPTRFRPGPEGAAAGDWRRVVASAVRQLDELRYPGAEPELDIVLAGDLADPSTLEASEIRFRCGPVVAPRWRVEGIHVDAVWVDRRLRLDVVEVRDSGGRLTASGDFRDGTATFELLSTLHPGPFLGMIDEKSPLHGLRVNDHPSLEAEGSIRLAPFKLDAIGSFAAGRVEFRGVKLDRVSTAFAIRDGAVFLQGGRMEADGGAADFDMLNRPGDFRVRVVSSIPPNVFLPVLDDKAAAVVRQMEFRDHPRVAFEVRGNAPSFAAVKGSGSVKLGRSALRDVWLDSGDSAISVADRAITYRDFRLVRGRGVATGDLTYDIGRREVRLRDIACSMNPVDVMMWIDPKISETLKAYRFREAPKTVTNGMVHLEDPSKNRLGIQVVAEGGMDYDLLGRTLRLGRTEGRVDITGSSLVAKVSRARIMDGEASLTAKVSLDRAKPSYGVDVEVRKLDFAELTKLYFNYDNSQGLLSGNYRFTTISGREREMEGEGSLRVEDGNVFAIPILGPLSDILNKIIPGAGYETARLATADFVVGEGKISTKNLAIEGVGFTMLGYGDIFYVSDRMDLSIRINAQGIPGLVFFPVSKLFEYVSTGTVSKPEWRPKIIPRFGN